MKRSRTKFFICSGLVAFLLLGQGCGDEKETVPPIVPDEPKQSIIIPADENTAPVLEQVGGTTTLSFTATADWKAEVGAMTRAADWVSVQPTQGSAGEAALTISTTPNDTYDERNAAITLTCAGQRTVLTVTQKQRDALLLTSHKVELEADGGTFTLNLKANVQVSAEIEPGIDWLKAAYTKTRALTETTLTFQVDENTNPETRQAVITLTGGGLTEQVSVYQAGSGSMLVLGQREYLVGSKGETIEVQLRSNTTYNVQMPTSDWLTEASTKAVSAYTHYFTIAPNDSYDGREAQIIFTEKDGKTTQAVTIYQAPSNALVVARTACKTSYQAGTLTFRKQTDAILIMETEQNWITCTTDGSMLSFSFPENSNPDFDREAIINIKDEDTGRMQQILLIQSRYGRELLKTTYDMYMAWDVKGFVQDESGNITFNPSLDQPADWYEASYVPICMRIRNYSDGSRAASTTNDYGFLFSGAKFTQPYYIMDNYGSLASLPETDLFIDYRKEEIPRMEFDGNSLVKTYYGSAREVSGIDLKKLRTTELKNTYIRYVKGEQIQSHTPYMGQYDLYSLSGPARVWLTPEEVKKLEAYFGRKVTYDDLLDLDAGQMVDILGSSKRSNPYLDLPDGTFNFAYNHGIVLSVKGSKVHDNWDPDSNEALAYGITFTESDGFFIERTADNGPQMLTYPKNTGTQDYHTDMKILSDDKEKTVGVLKLTLEQTFDYENTKNGFPDIPDRWGDKLSDNYYTGFSFKTIMYDTLVCYKQPDDAPFKISNHYYYCDNGRFSQRGGAIDFVIHPDCLSESINQGLGGFIGFEFEMIPDVDWIYPDPSNPQSPTEAWKREDGRYHAGWDFRIDPYYELYPPRIGHITLKIKGGDYLETIRVVQYGGQFSKINEENFNFDYKGGIFSITGQTNWPKKIRATWDVDWIVKSAKTRGMSDITLGPLQVLENTSSQPRTATITVWEGKYTNGTLATITVTQEGRPNAVTKAIVPGKRPDEAGSTFQKFIPTLYPWQIGSIRPQP